MQSFTTTDEQISRLLSHNSTRLSAIVNSKGIEFKLANNLPLNRAERRLAKKLKLI